MKHDEKQKKHGNKKKWKMGSQHWGLINYRSKPNSLLIQGDHLFLNYHFLGGAVEES
jgi:hypothetical protein